MCVFNLNTLCNINNNKFSTTHYIIVYHIVLLKSVLYPLNQNIRLVYDFSIRTPFYSYTFYKQVRMDICMYTISILLTGLNGISIYSIHYFSFFSDKSIYSNHISLMIIEGLKFQFNKFIDATWKVHV